MGQNFSVVSYENMKGLAERPYPRPGFANWPAARKFKLVLGLAFAVPALVLLVFFAFDGVRSPSLYPFTWMTLGGIEAGLIFSVVVMTATRAVFRKLGAVARTGSEREAREEVRPSVSPNLQLAESGGVVMNRSEEKPPPVKLRRKRFDFSLKKTLTTLTLILGAVPVVWLGYFITFGQWPGWWGMAGITLTTLTIEILAAAVAVVLIVGYNRWWPSEDD